MSKTKLDIAQVRKSLGLRTLTPQDIRALRHAWGLSQRELGGLLGLKSVAPDYTVRQWELGKNKISEPTSIALILLQHVLESRHK